MESFGDQLAEALFDDKRTSATRHFPPELRRVTRRRLLYLYDAADLVDLRSPPSNRLEALKDNWKDYHSIRINDQWRVIFRWESGAAQDVRVIDYHH